MFDTLSDRLDKVFTGLRGKGRLSDEDIDATAREIRIALLEADVALPVVRTFIAAVKERAAGADVILFRFADVTTHLPGQRIVAPRAAMLNDGARRLAEKHGAYLIDLFADDTFHNPAMWSADRLHLSPAGHRRVAGHVLTALGVGVDEDWLLVPPQPAPTS